MKHQLCRPASPGAIIAKAIADSGDSLDYVAALASMTPTRLRRILDGRRRVRPKDARRLAIPLHRWTERFAAEIAEAQAACERWDEEERRMAKERAK